MKISDEQLDKIARLCRLNIEVDQKEVLKQEMEMILDWVETLNQIDTSSVEPLIYLSNKQQSLRKDKVGAHLSTSRTLENAPEHDDNFFVVPQVIKGSDE